MPASPELHVFGIRHHGPGSARSLRRSLEALRPDCVLIEGPPDADGVIPMVAHDEMKPPVAILVYAADEPKHAVYYPFAVFSPEWQALSYALKHKATVRFMDLPQAHRLAMADKPEASDAAAGPKQQPPAPSAVNVPPGAAPTGAVPPIDPATPPEAAAPGEPSDRQVRRDPLGAVALAAGYDDGERWWEHMVETRREDADLFAAVLEMMSAIREKSPFAEEKLDLKREAWMRQTIRAAQKEGFKKIAVVCGAWHAPVLAKMAADEKADAALLKGLPKTKVNATWVPWTYGRLSFASGYGAGVTSPGWYHHLWNCGSGGATNGDQKGSKTQPSRATPSGDPTQLATVRWMTRVAHLLRGEDLDASSASVIESVRLAESLAAIRGAPLPGLPELNEAALTVFCFGNDAPLRLIHDRLIVGESLGQVPDETPMVPLQLDLQREQKRLRLVSEASQKDIVLDLRNPTDLDRSRLLHRLSLLGIAWGDVVGQSGKGTFKEGWRLQWQPEFAVRLIEMAAWGNTVYEATAAWSRDRADKSRDLPALTDLLDKVLLADLPPAVEHLMDRVQAEAAVASDVSHLMGALPPLANVLRYGNVRKADTTVVGRVVDGLVARVCIGLPPATASLNDEAAAAMFERVLAVHEAVTLLQNAEHLNAWHRTLKQLADQQGLHGLLAGRAVRLLLDANALTADEAARRMSLALSPANDPARSAGWVEGFLKGSGLLLLHDEPLWQVIDSWVSGLSADTFTQLLPLLRRTFATFTAPERRQMGERVKKGPATPARAAASSGAAPDEEFDRQRAEAVLPLVARLLGIR